MVNVVTVAAYKRIYWLRLVGLVQRLAATGRYICRMNRVNSGSGSALHECLRRQHHKRCHGYYYYYYYV